MEKVEQCEKDLHIHLLRICLPPSLPSYLPIYLQPWVHYVPIRPDASDLMEKVEQCEKDLPRCEAIAKRATEYIRYVGR